MATKSVLKSSASALFALLLGTAALLPATASAQERDQRGPARMERMERPAPAPAPAQAPAWQNRAPAAAAAPSGWQGRPAWSSNGGQADRPSPPANQGGWQGRQAWQNGGGDRERGDRGNGAFPNGQPTFGRPAWAQGGQVPQPQPRTDTPTWGARNPTYVDPNRANRGGQWQNDGRGNWNRDRDGDRNDDWRRNNNNGGQWNRGNGWSSNTSRDWNRDRDRDRDGWRGNRWGNNNGWRGNGWGYNNGWRGNAWGYNNGWRGNGWGYNNGWRAWDRDGWRRDNRYNWYGWRNTHRSVFSLGFYTAPWQGYSYSRLGIGVILGAPFYSQRYWIADPWAFRLPPADGPYRWVRYYDDALLVDIYSGEVVDVIYDIFY